MQNDIKLKEISTRKRKKEIETHKYVPIQKTRSIELILNP